MPESEVFKIVTATINMLWLEVVAGEHAPDLPVPEGEPIILTRLTFEVPCPASAFLALVRTGRFTRLDSTSLGVSVADGRQPTILGAVTCGNGTLSLAAFSASCAERARLELERVLGPLAVRATDDVGVEALDFGELDEEVGGAVRTALSTRASPAWRSPAAAFAVSPGTSVTTRR